LLLLSRTVAAAGTLLYHLANVGQLASSGRHLGPAGAALIAGTPYTVGGLLLLASSELVQTLGGWLTAGTLAAWPSAGAFGGRGGAWGGAVLLQRGGRQRAQPDHETHPAPLPQGAPGACCCRGGGDSGSVDCGCRVRVGGCVAVRPISAGRCCAGHCPVPGGV